MKTLSTGLLSGKNILLALSIATNIVLILTCLIAFQKLTTVYTDYRHFRALPVGVSNAGMSATADNAVVLFGDSRVELWTPPPVLTGKKTINAGVAGETTTEMRRRFDNDVLRHNPQTVIIQAGVNDLTASVTRNIPTPIQLREKMFENLEYFVSTLTAAGTQVVLTSIIPNKELNPLRKLFWHPTLLQTISSSNLKLQQLAEKHQAIWLDIDDVFVDTDNAVRAGLYKDTLHINSEAYAQINARLNKLFQ